MISYAKHNDMAIVDFYIDDGYSARKKYTSRKSFMRLMSDVEANKIDVILFIKLDRWFRNIKDYYKIQEILERHNVGWIATQEHYDTTTANGRLHVNIRLAIAQDEADRTSERIKFVFDNKVARGEVISGAVPMGFKIENKRLVHDETKKDMVVDMFDHYAAHHSKYGTHLHMIERWGINIERMNLSIMLRNTLYIGEYRGNKDYCEPLIARETFDKAQAISKARGIRKSSTGRVYIFSGLVRCAECGRSCVGQYSQGKYLYYRCNWAMREHRCSNRIAMNESHIEKWLLENIEDKIKEHIDFEVRLTKGRKKKPPDAAKIKRKLAKLKDLYINDLITLEEYRTDYDALNARLAEEITPVNENRFTGETLLNFLDSDMLETYPAMDRKEKQVLWRGIIKEIRMNSDRELSVFLL